MKKLLALILLSFSIGVFAQIYDEVETSTNSEKGLSLEEARPLILVNDLEINFDELNDLNSDEIKSVHIIKKKKDLKEYGEKGENGVVLVTLKENLKPLVILDGEEISFDIANEMDSNLFEKVKVFKGQAAVDLYGVKGIKGVVEIYSKKEVEEE